MTTEDRADSAHVPALNKVLLIEDNAADARLIRTMFEDAGWGDSALTVVERLSDAEAYLAEDVDLDAVLLDLSLPDASGLEALQSVLRLNPDLNVIVLTGLNDGAIALEAVLGGAQDFLVKDQIDAATLVRSIRYAMQRKRAAAADRQRQVLNDTLARMEQMLVAIGYELRTPLAAIRALAEVMKMEDRWSYENSVRVRTIETQAIRASEVVNNMIEATRLNAGCSNWKWVPFDLRSTVEKVARQVQSLMRNDRIRFEVQVPDAECRIKGDPDAIELLLINLLNNAVTHTQQGEIVLSLQRVPGLESTHVQLAVADTGSGMPGAVLERIGEPFELNWSKLGEVHSEGSGMGLVICRGIVSAHGGRLSVETEPKAGTRFEILLRTDLEAPQQVSAAPIEKSRAVKSDERPAS